MGLDKYTKFVSNQTISTVTNKTKRRSDRISFEALHREGFNGIENFFVIFVIDLH